MIKFKKYWLTTIKLIVVISMIFSLVLLLNNNEVEGNVSNELGTEIFYDNYYWVGLTHYREKNYATMDGDLERISHRNFRTALVFDNLSTINQKATYSYTESTGHVLSAKIKAAYEVIEVEVGYEFSFSTETTVSAEVTAKPKTRITVKIADICKRETTIDIFKEKEVMKLFKWKYLEDLYSFYEYIYQYEGVYLFVTETNLN